MHGEIVRRSPQLLTDNWNEPEETILAFARGSLHSGDVGYFDEEGHLIIGEHFRDVINTGGVLVANREVEEGLFTHPAVSAVAVVGRPDEARTEEVAAFVALRQGQTVDSDTLIARARGYLALFKLPKKVNFVHSLPKNTAAKLLKRELRRQHS